MVSARSFAYQDFLFHFANRWCTNIYMHEAFDPEPIRELPADEPRTPMWLPAVGVALFVALGALFCLTGPRVTSPGATSASAVAPSSSASAAQAPAAAAHP